MKSLKNKYKKYEYLYLNVMSKLFDYKTLIIIILLLILYLNNCKTNKENSNTIIVDNKNFTLLKYKVDTVEKLKTRTEVKRGDDIYFEKIYIDTQYLYKDVDTASILINFFTKVVFKDTLMLPDSVGFVFLIDTINQNKIQTRTYTTNFTERTIQEKIILKDLPKNEYYFGFNTNFNNVTLVSSVGTSFLLKHKKNYNIYQLSTGLSQSNGNVLPYIGGGVYFKINK